MLSKGIYQRLEVNVDLDLKSVRHISLKNYGLHVNILLHFRNSFTLMVHEKINEFEC